MTTVNFKHAREQLNARMEAIIAANPVTVPREAQSEFDSCLAAIKILDQVGTATMAGVDMNNVQIDGNGTLVTRRRADGQDVFEAGQVVATAGASKPIKKRGYLAEDIFGKQPIKSQYTSIEQFMFDIQYGGAKMTIAGASSGVPSDGGFLIPPQFVFDQLNRSVETEIVRPRCRNEGMTSDSKTIATYDDTSHAGGTLFGGLQLQWVPQGDDISFQIPKTRQMVLYAKKAVIMVPATNELIADAPNYGGELTKIMSTSLSFGLDRSFLVSGIGAGQPMSCLNASSTITVAKEVSQATGTIVYENLTKVFSRLHPASFANSVWIVSQSALPQLLELTIAIGTAGAFIKVLNESNGTYSILGRPVIFSEKMNTVGSLGDIMLVDLSQYCVGVREDGFRLDQSSHLLFKSDQTVWRLVMRIDGQPTWASVFQPLNSAPTQSWCVTLAARP